MRSRSSNSTSGDMASVGIGLTPYGVQVARAEMLSNYTRDWAALDRVERVIRVAEIYEGMLQPAIWSLFTRKITTTTGLTIPLLEGGHLYSIASEHNMISVMMVVDSRECPSQLRAVYYMVAPIDGTITIGPYLAEWSKKQRKRKGAPSEPNLAPVSKKQKI